jgi:hypothetical protein
MIDIDKAFEGRWHYKWPDYDRCEIRQVTAKEIKELCRDFFEAGFLLSQQPPQENKNSTNLFERSIPFNQSVFTTENVQKYGQQMLQDFYEYWTEPNPSNTKMRFELQKTWDVNRRLARWARNNFNRYDRQQPTLEQRRKSKLADILTD